MSFLIFQVSTVATIYIFSPTIAYVIGGFFLIMNLLALIHTKWLI